ncbi:MAG: HupE/UreJ family protein [Ferruginibacter sp.]|nr:HupE/UreJ family protein [Ferruginibacter sp.]
MQDFVFYFKEGWHHIISLDALDHLLFIVALAAIYLVQDWKRVLVLVTAFTIGHSLTLVASVYNLISINEGWVEFLIPCTIVFTAMFNLGIKNYDAKKIKLNYSFALFFGLIHGLGYANTIKFMLAKNQSMGWSLFSFNIGLEAGQILVVAIILTVSFVVVNKLKLQQIWWVRVLSIIALLVALNMALRRLPFDNI